MGKIAVLDQQTIDKIAAGEVVERPLSVVKELVENAIDAGATSVAVEIRDGGISLIRITDNGAGIESEQVPTAFLRHATSKIRSAEDLVAISSLGFRGEALSSIAAVAQVELITKTAGAFSGTRYQIDGGVEKSIEDIGAPDGTTFLVRNLFYNVPARKKFLKTAQTEGSYIGELMERLALSRPDIAFKFIQNNQTKLHTSGNTRLADVIYHIYHREIASNLIPVFGQMPGVKIEGFIGKPVVSRGNRNYENYFVNGRYVKSKIIAGAIEESYKEYMMQHKYPFTVLHLTIDGELLDVNVHPQKMELRISNQEKVYHFIKDTLYQALHKKELIPEVEFGRETPQKKENVVQKSAPEPFERKRLEKSSAGTFVKEPAPAYVTKPEPVVMNVTGKQNRELDNKAVFPIVTATETVVPAIGLVQESAENASQHTGGAVEISSKEKSATSGIQSAVRADAQSSLERLQALSKQQESGNESKVLSQNQENTNATIQTQKVNIQPESELTPKGEQMELFESRLISEESRKRHRVIGQLFDTYWLVEFEDKLFIVDQHAAHEKVLYEKNMELLKKKEHSSQLISPPIILSVSMHEEEVLNKHMESFQSLGFKIEHFGGREYSVCAVPMNLYNLNTKDILMEMLDSLAADNLSSGSQIVLEKLASMSCKAAVKGNHAMSMKEMEALMDQLLKCENPYNCPHGRPTIISMTKYEIEKKFKRIV